MSYLHKFRCIVTALFLTPMAWAHDNCSTIVGSAQDAANKAEWVLEADVSKVLQLKEDEGYFYVTIENVTMLHEAGKSPRFFTAMLRSDACFANPQATFGGKNKLTGKRMRFFGTQMTGGRGRQFFYAQAADQPLPQFAKRKQYLTAGHEVVVTEGSDGWYRAHSNEGGFSIDMPGAFENITKGNRDGGEPAFMLRGTDQFGSGFLAVFERSGPDSNTGKGADEVFGRADAKKMIFKGAEAASSIGKYGERTTHGLWFRVPGGTFMLAIVTDKEHEEESMKFKDRFYNSLTFD